MSKEKKEQTLLRKSILLGIIRWGQLIGVAAVLGITALNASFWHSISCNTPVRLIINIAMAGAFVPIILYLLFTSWPLNKCLKCLPLNRWLQLIMDGLSVIIWIVAGVLSTYNCTDLCTACKAPGILLGGEYQVEAGDLTCNCIIPSMINTRSDISPAPLSPLVRRKGSHSSSHSSSYHSSSSHSSNKYGSKTHMDIDWIMAVLSLIAIILGLLYIFLDTRAKKRAKAARNNPAAGAATYAMQEDMKYNEQASLIQQQAAAPVYPVNNATAYTPQPVSPIPAPMPIAAPVPTPSPAPAPQGEAASYYQPAGVPFNQTSPHPQTPSGPFAAPVGPFPQQTGYQSQSAPPYHQLYPGTS